LTGIIVWEDWRVVSSWLGYICVFLLMTLGCSLLLGDLGLIQESAPETFRGARPTIVLKSERDKLLKNIKNIPKLTDPHSMDNESRDRISATYHGIGSTPILSSSGSTDRSNTKPNTRRTTRASFHGSVSSTEIQRPGLGQRSSSVSAMFQLHRNPITQSAWAAIYENGHATHQGSCYTDSSLVAPPRTLHADIDDDDDGDGDGDIEGSNDNEATQQRRPLSRPFRDGFAVCNWDSFRRRLIEEASGEISLDSGLNNNSVATTDNNNNGSGGRESRSSSASSQDRLHDQHGEHHHYAGRGLEVLTEGIEDNSCSVLDDGLADTSSQDSKDDDRTKHAA
jgi:hypothetical protein